MIFNSDLNKLEDFITLLRNNRNRAEYYIPDSTMTFILELYGRLIRELVKENKRIEELMKDKIFHDEYKRLLGEMGLSDVPEFKKASKY